MTRRPLHQIAILAMLAVVGGRGTALAELPVHPPEGEQFVVPDPPTQQEREKVRQSKALSLEAQRELMESALLLTPSPVDVERYTLDIRVTPPPTRRVDGTVRIQARVAGAPIGALTINLYDNMAITSIVAAGGTALSSTRGSNLVNITLNRVYATGELVDLTITYGGSPVTAASGDLRWAFSFMTHGPTSQPIISSLSEPTYAPVWWPCIDRPDDKAIVDVDLTVPSSLTGVSNGVLTANVLNGDGTRTFKWRSSYPISNYLVSVAISNYVTWTDFYTPVTGGPVMPVQHWVYPEHETQARTDFNVTGAMLFFYSTLFGEYPFVAEKYGHAIFPFGGGMEHQTVTSYGAGLITGSHTYDWITAHELAHQWWGDAVGPAEWPEIWLNEGFATYSEALWREYIAGTSAYNLWMDSLDSRPFCGTVYNPPGACGLFGHTVYDKGGWVLHMLRHVLGDTAFFQGLRNYFTTYDRSNATTPAFRDVMEAASGIDLDAFFQQWVYQPGEPSYRFGWTVATTPSGYVPHLRIEQAQGGTPFVMPIDIQVIWPGGTQTFVVQNDSLAQDIALPPVPSLPTSILFDPTRWILRSFGGFTLADADADGVPDTADNCVAIANPVQDDLDGDGAGNACDPDIDGDGRTNGTDCAPLDPATADPPGSEPTGLMVASGATTDLTWVLPGAATPAWTSDIVRGSVLQLRADGGMGAAACFGTALPLPAATDASVPASGDGWYYVSRARNVCGAGPLGSGSNGVPRPAIACP